MSQASLAGSKGMRFAIIYERGAKRAKRAGQRKSSGALSLSLPLSMRKEPLAPYPRRAMLTTMKEKWYQRAIENVRKRATSKRSVEAEINHMPA
jgi:hypothetical protein